MAERHKSRVFKTGFSNMKLSRARSVAIASVVLCAAASSGAWAADLGPYKPYNPPAPAPAPYVEPAIWEGAYIGVNGGYGWSNSGATDADGAFGGGQIGYNWQRGRLVFGIEGDFQGSDINSSNSGLVGSDMDWFSTVRGRVGLANGPLLIYGTGGVAFADITNRFTVVEDSDTKTGYAVGGGLEYAFAPNWSAKAEYLFLGFGDDTVAGTTIKVDDDVHTARVGLNYHF
jgi:outer membrane immunogenic protein